VLNGIEFVASLASLGPYAWVKLSNDDIRFTVIPEQGTQVWAYVFLKASFLPLN
jgi:HUS1 checkpoint protein